VVFRSKKAYVYLYCILFLSSKLICLPVFLHFCPLLAYIGQALNVNLWEIPSVSWLSGLQHWSSPYDAQFPLPTTAHSLHVLSGKIFLFTFAPIPLLLLICLQCSSFTSFILRDDIKILRSCLAFLCLFPKKIRFFSSPKPP